MELLLILFGALLGWIGHMLQQWFTERAAHRERRRTLLADLQARISQHLDARTDHLRKISRELNEAPNTGRDAYVIVHLMTLASSELYQLDRATDELLLNAGQVTDESLRLEIQQILENSRTSYVEVPKGENPRIYEYFDWLEAWDQRLRAGRDALAGRVGSAIRALDRPG